MKTLRIRKSKTLSRFRLTRDEERELFVSYQRAVENGDKREAGRIIGLFYLANRGLIHRIARYYATVTGAPADELECAGAFGIFDALKRFEVERGTAFITYAQYWIRLRITDAISASLNRSYQVPRGRVSFSVMHIASAMRIAYGKGQDISDPETLKEILVGFDQKMAQELSLAMIQRLQQVIIDQAVASVPLDGECMRNGLAIEETIPDELNLSLDVLVDFRALHRRYLEKLKRLRTANPRHFEMLLRYYGLTDGEAETLERIGERFGLTRERIRQLILVALDWMDVTKEQFEAYLAALQAVPPELLAA